MVDHQIATCERHKNDCEKQERASEQKRSKSTVFHTAVRVNEYNFVDPFLTFYNLQFL